MGLEAERRPQIVLESGRLYNIQRRSSLPATELGVFGRTSSGASGKFVPIHGGQARGGTPFLLSSQGEVNAEYRVVFERTSTKRARDARSS